MNQVEGYVVDSNDTKKVLFKADWTKVVCSCKPEYSDALNEMDLSSSDLNPPPGVTVDWRVRPKPSYAKDVS